MLRSSTIWFPKDSKAGSLETLGLSSTVNSSHPSRWRSADLEDLPLVTSASPADTNTGLARRWLRARGRRLAVYLSLAIAGHALLAFGLPFYRWAMRSHHGVRRTGLVELQATVPPECAHLKSPPPGWTFETSSSTGMPRSHQSSQASQTSASPKHQLQMQTSQRGMTQACADQWIARSTVCENIRQGKHNLQEEDIDVAWSFVVPDEHWAKWKAHHEVQTSIVTGSAAARFRYYNQLRFSMRSVFENVPFLRRGHMIAASVPAHAPSEPDTGCRMVQTPSWLNLRATQIGDARLKVVSHQELFSQSLNQSDLYDYDNGALPNFNSVAIEAQLRWLPASTLLYLNDDFYVNKELAPADIASLLLGPTFRLTRTRHPTEQEFAASSRNLHKRNREIYAVNSWSLLDHRFGKRNRPWPSHFAYTMNIPMLQEVAYTWPDEMLETSTSRFRDSCPQIRMYLVATYYMIEKHREALLWSFLVAAADEDGSGSYSYEERANMRQKIRATTKNGYLHVDEPDRPGTYNRAAYYSDRLEDAHTKRPKETVYVWSSQDGYPFLGPAKKTFRELTGVQTSFCHMPVERCFGHSDFFDEESSGEATFTRHLSPEDLFKNMAFRNTGCGDCLIASLLAASGSHGLSAFLPEARSINRRQKTPIDQTEVPVIGDMSRDWESADFSLATSLRGKWQAREFAVRLLQRYSYTLGASRTHFSMMQNVQKGQGFFEAVKAKQPAFMCINDDIKDEDVTSHNKTLQAWHKRTFRKKTEYEV